MSEDSTTTSWSIFDDGSSLSTGVIVSTAIEDDVISLFSTLDIIDDNDGISTSIATNSHFATNPIPKCTTNLFQEKLDALAGAPDNDDHDDGDDGIDSPLLPPLRRGKRLLHHSLTRRDRSAPFFASSHTMMHHDEYIEVVRRNVDKQTGLCPKTPIDDLIPDLVMPSFRHGTCDLTATLGRGKRWETVIELFEALEKDGRAIRLPPRRDHRHNSEHHFRFYGNPPHETTRYSVQPNGAVGFGRVGSSIYGRDDVNSINQRISLKANARGNNLPFVDGVEYELHLTKQRGDGTDEVRRQHTFKGRSHGDRWGNSRRDRVRAARRRNRASARKEMSESFSFK